MSETEDLYEILQLHPSAHQDVLDAAYRRLALLYNPATDPSTEAAAKLAAVSRAYAVLGDPEKRAAYEQNRGTPASPTQVQEEKPSESDPPKLRPRRKAKQSSLDYITIGSTKEDVSQIQGPPSSTSSSVDLGYEGEVWSYSQEQTRGGALGFNKTGRVVWWFNQGSLNVRIVPGLNVTTSETFSIGSHKDDVVRLQETPYRISVPSRRTSASIQEERENRRFHQEVMREIGKPLDPDGETPIGRYDEDPDRETWYYEGGVVEFSIATSRVTAWDNQDGSLKAIARWPEREEEWDGEVYFTTDSTQGDVRRAQGGPHRQTMDPTGIEVWSYGKGRTPSQVNFSQGRVVAWSNWTATPLKVRIVPGTNVTSSPYFSLGFHKDDVVRLQGTPRSISALKDPFALKHGGGYETWWFGSSRISLSISGYVIDWNNPEGELKVRGIRPDRKLPRNHRYFPSQTRGGTTLVVLGLAIVAAAAAAFFC